MIFPVVLDSKTTHLVELQDSLTIAAAEQHISNWARNHLKLTAPTLLSSSSSTTAAAASASSATLRVISIALPAARGDSSNLTTGDYSAPIDRNVATLSRTIQTYCTNLFTTSNESNSNNSSGSVMNDLAEAQNEVARLSKIVENQTQIIATRGKTVSELRTKLKEHENAAAQYEQKLKDTGRKVAEFWRARLAAHKQQLDATLATFISSSATVLAGGEFPKLEEKKIAAAANDDDDKDDEVDEEEEDEDDEELENEAESPREVKAPKLVNSDSSGSEDESDETAQRKAALKNVASVGTTSSAGQSSLRIDNNNNNNNNSSSAINTALATSSSSSSSSSSNAAKRAESFAFKSIRETAVKSLAWPENVVNVHIKMREIWSKPIDVGTTYKDIPRLVRRVRLTIDDSVVALPQSTSHLVLTAELIRTLALKLESMDADAKARLNADCDLLAAVDPTENPELAVGRVISNALGANSSTVGVLRCIQQGVVLPLSLWLKAHTCILSKDVTTPDGWRIEVDIRSDSTPGVAPRVVVSHIRKEQSLSHAPHEQFVFTYRLRFLMRGAVLEACDARFVGVGDEWTDSNLAPQVKASLEVLHMWNDCDDDIVTALSRK